MNRQQLFKRIAPEAVSRIVREWNEGLITTQAAMDALALSRPQLYRLRTKWLSLGKSDMLATGVSGGDHSAAWPPECVEHLERMLPSSGRHGPNYELYADELERKFGFHRDRSNVRKYCEAHFGKLLRTVFLVEHAPRSCSGPRASPTRRRCCESGHVGMREPPAFKKVRMFLSLRERRRVELGGRIDFDGRRVAAGPRQVLVLRRRSVVNRPGGPARLQCAGWPDRPVCNAFSGEAMGCLILLTSLHALISSVQAFGRFDILSAV